MESKSKAEGVKGIMDIEDRGLLFGSGKRKLVIREVVFSKIVTEFKLRRFNFSKDFFSGIKFSFSG